VADQRLAPPVLGNVTEHAMFCLVSFAGARREVAHGDAQAGLHGELMKTRLPESGSISIVSAGVGQDQQRRHARVGLAAHAAPPPTDRLGGKLGGIVVGPHAHPAMVLREVVDPVGDDLAQFGVGEIVDVRALRPRVNDSLPG
jgi:hypothetical protein